MRFSVMVPVLSEQMTEVHPSVSTLCRRLTSAFCFIMRLTARASAMVTVAGSPSGIAAIAMEMPVMSISKIGSPRSTPAANTARHTPMQMTARTFPSSPRRFCRGVSVRSMEESIPEICPICVFFPVATTSAVPLPRVRAVPLYTR